MFLRVTVFVAYFRRLAMKKMLTRKKREMYGNSEGVKNVDMFPPSMPFPFFSGILHRKKFYFWISPIQGYVFLTSDGRKAEKITQP